MSHNPWKAIPKPQGESYFKTLRVDSGLNSDNLPISWAVDYEGNKAVYFEFPRDDKQKKELKLPSFKALHIRDIDYGPKNRALAVILKESDMGDLFYEICCDLISSVQSMPPALTRTILIQRLERWSSLLRGGSVGLSLEAQRGLFAEMLFLERIAIPVMGEQNAINGWIGPEGGHQDFCFGQTFIEVKSKHGSSTNVVKISSEHQLAVNSTERLFLYVVEENESNSDAGTSLTELALRIRQSISSPITKTMFITKLLAVGFDFSSIYDCRWTIGAINCFEVTEGFPRIVDVKNGLSHVSYALDLGVCTDYLSNESAVLSCMRGIDD